MTINEYINLEKIKGKLGKITGIKWGARDRYRELVRIRDNHTCQKCGLEWQVGERRLDVHHLDEDSTKTRQIDGDEDMDNMITLCHKCHLNLDGHRETMAIAGKGNRRLGGNEKWKALGY